MCTVLLCLSLATQAEGYRKLDWEELVPKDWQPAAASDVPNLAWLRDDDPRARELLAGLRRALDDAPVVPGLRGARVRLPGYVVPLERKGDELREFLLVPYYGACIHTPPPPANQIVHVKPAKPLRGLHTMDAVWVSGTLDTGRVDTGMGAAGYRLRAEVVTPYGGR
ncbi:MAG: DUF3299 domain-containing protein [Rhodocyclaceae bacterium]